MLKSFLLPMNSVIWGVCMFVASGCTPSAEVSMVREVSGFSRPESVLYDRVRDRLYVSNVDGPSTAKDGNGFLSLVSLDGEMLEREWAVSLHAPKGLAMWEDYVYVTDIDRLVVIDCNSGDILETYAAEGAQFLNDIAVNGSDVVYVSDMYTNTIYALENETLSVFLKSDELENPNGLTIVGDELIVACWGAMKPDWSTEVPGHLKAVHLKTKEIRDIGTKPVGNLDGLEVTDRGTYLVTDHAAGALLEITPAGEVTQLVDCDAGSADLEYVSEKDLVIIPMMEDDSIVMYRL